MRNDGPEDATLVHEGKYLDFCVRAAGAKWKVAIVPEFEAVYPSNDPELVSSPKSAWTEDQLM